MNYLLDTHVLLWSIGKSNELSETAKKTIEDTNNDIFVSAISLWEIAIKYSLGKLILGSIDPDEIINYCKTLNFALLALQPEDAIESYKLKKYDTHKDPFDRLLIYQCIKNDYSFISKDEKLGKYKINGLKLIW